MMKVTLSEPDLITAVREYAESRALFPMEWHGKEITVSLAANRKDNGKYSFRADFEEQPSHAPQEGEQR